MAKIRGIKPETWTDEKIVSVSPLARLLFFGMWNFACDNGHLDNSPIQLKMRILPADNCDVAELVAELVAAGLIEIDGEYIVIPNLTEHQKPHRKWWKTCDAPGCERPSKRPVNKSPQVGNGGSTGGHGCSTADVDGDVDGDVDVEVKTSTSGTADAARADVTEILDHLDSAITANGARPPKRGKTNINAARLLIDRDKRTVEQIKAAIDYATNDEFWRANILSMSKLREKYDTLRLHAQRQQQRHGNNPRKETTDDRVNAGLELARRLAERDQTQIPQIGA